MLWIRSTLSFAYSFVRYPGWSFAFLGGVTHIFPQFALRVFRIRSVMGYT